MNPNSSPVPPQAADVDQRAGTGRGEAGPTFELTPHESVRVLRHSPRALEVEGRWAPHGQAPPTHFHPYQDERFEMLEGELHARIGGQELALRPGDVLEVPRGAVHQMWNEGDVPARAIWRTSPAGRTASWFADLSALRRSGRVGRNGMPGPLAFGVYLTAYDDVIRLAGPQPLMGAVLAVLAGIGRLRGYRPAARGAWTPARSGQGARMGRQCAGLRRAGRW